ncbi:serine/threonine-protein kinase hal4 [Sclerotinia borealis F-4128]|uniref:non-specific serine/threonine protein kinase n=1 Tax=Sclerotinia borealis (strain F-4128) TaxID=1432307 RepID=W9CGE6_SCLBF|nr:serine/threonine-protein kinase hal4 [Sclerotinia borealis F-4128]
MASVAVPRDIATEKAQPSPTPSLPSSSHGSPQSRPTTSNVSAITSTENLSMNGTLTPPPPAFLKPAPIPTNMEKPSMTKRLTRMFSTKDPIKSESSLTSAAPSSSSTPKPADGTTSPQPTPSRPGSLSRNTSSQEKKNLTDKTSAAPTSKDKNGSTKDKKAPAPHQRFLPMPDVQGGHEHHLKSAKRQEKLGEMLRGLISGKAKQPETHEGEQQLSLMSNWVDQLKREKESLATEKKGGPNATATLVDKYGKCNEVIGRGAFGIVRISHKRSEQGTEQLYAVKEFRRRPEENERKYSKRLTSEFCISSSLRHPNVIHTLDLLQDSKGDYCEVMEFCAGGDLYTLVLAAGKLEVVEADCYFKQMMRGVEYMHEMGVAHRDLKPENLLLTTHGSLKITDFGNGECFRMAWEKDAHMVTGLCGSAPYIAPEEYIDKEFDARAVDVWATGVIYMAMRTGRHLWRVAKKDEDEFFERYLEGRRDEEGYAPIESLHRARCRNVIYSILDPNPHRRITASQVLKSEWGREIKLCQAGEEGL